MAIRFLSNETLDGTLTVNGLLTGASATFSGNITFGATNPFQQSTNVLDGTGTNGARIRSAVSSATNPTFSNSDDTDTGMYFSAADTLDFTTGGTNALSINSSQNATFAGDVGMATGHSSGKFAVMSSAVHGSYDFYNNGTSYFNGAVIVDAAFSQTGGTGSTFSGAVYAPEFDLPSLGKLDWANGDARIIEGEVGGYSLSFEIYNGSSALERVMLLEKDKTVSIYGDSIVGAQSVTSSTTNYEYMLRVQGKNNYSDGTTWYGSYGQILLHADTNMTGGARRFLITNALGSNKFAIVRSVDGNTDPVVVSTSSGIDSGTADFVINNSGLIGIGTTSPTQKLDVNGNIYATGRTQSGNTLIGTKTISSTDFATLGSNSSGVGIAIARDHAPASYPDIIINSSGQVGIGTASPTSKLTIDNGSAAGGTLLTSSNASYTAHFVGNTGTGNAGIYCDGSNGDFIGSDYMFMGQADDKWAEIKTFTSAEGIRFSPRDVTRFTINNIGITNIYNNTAIGSSSAGEPQRLTVLKTESNGNGIWRFGTSGSTFTFTGHRFFSTITGTATSNGWYTIGNVADSCSVIIVIKTAAHSQATILASRGYGLSNVARVQVLSSTKNANSGYANITEARISGGGIIDMRLVWSSGPNVSVSVTYYGNGCDLPADLRLSISDTGTYPYNVTDTATFRSTAASARVAGELDIASQTHCGSNINMYSTSKIFFHATTNSGRYIGASSTNDLDIAADDDINYRSNYNRFRNGSVEYARLSDTSNSWIATGSNGKLGIGTTSPTARLYVSSFGSGTTDTVKIVHGNGSHTGNGLVLLSANTGKPFYLTGSVGSGFAEITTAYNANPNFRISGDIVAYATSDKKFKDNLNIIENPINKVQQLNGYTFDWNDKQDLYKGKDYGVVAQEVEKIMPEIVDTRFDGHKAVKYEKIVPLLIESIKELKTEIEELKKQIK